MSNGGAVMTRHSIATVSLSGGLDEKLRAIAAAGFTEVEIFENDFLGFSGSAGASARTFLRRHRRPIRAFGHRLGRRAHPLRRHRGPSRRGNWMRAIVSAA
jgi:sugar phosphate isomerase/epimerase